MNETRLVEPNERTWTGECHCTRCGGQWEQTSRVGVVAFTCPRCREQTGIWSHAVLPPKGHNVWACSCGCMAFTISVEGYYCMDCGLLTTREEVQFRLN